VTESRSPHHPRDRRPLPRNAFIPREHPRRTQGSACGDRERDASRARPAGAVAAGGSLPADYGMRAT